MKYKDLRNTAGHAVNKGRHRDSARLLHLGVSLTPSTTLYLLDMKPWTM